MDFKTAMTEWVHLKAQLAAARKDISTLNSREKELKGMISAHMKQNEIDTVNVQEKVKVNLKTKQTKGSITKDVIRKGLLAFFGGNEAQVEGAWTAIQDVAPSKETTSVSVTGLANL